MPLRLEDLTPDAQVTGLIGREAVRVVSIQTAGEAYDLLSGMAKATCSPKSCPGQGRLKVCPR